MVPVVSPSTPITHSLTASALAFTPPTPLKESCHGHQGLAILESCRSPDLTFVQRASWCPGASPINMIPFSSSIHTLVLTSNLHTFSLVLLVHLFSSSLDPGVPQISVLSPGPSSLISRQAHTPSSMPISPKSICMANFPSLDQNIQLPPELYLYISSRPFNFNKKLFSHLLFHYLYTSCPLLICSLPGISTIFYLFAQVQNLGSSLISFCPSPHIKSVTRSWQVYH